MRPGIVTKDASGAIKCLPIFSRIVSLFAEQNALQVGGGRWAGGTGDGRGGAAGSASLGFSEACSAITYLRGIMRLGVAWRLAQHRLGPARAPSKDGW